MKVLITARKFKAHDTLRDFIDSEVSSLQKYNEEILNADVVLSYQNSRESIKTAEIILKVPGQTLKAIEQSDDFKKSVTVATEKLVRQLQKFKTKKTARAR